jgi:hypothetical protein
MVSLATHHSSLCDQSSIKAPITLACGTPRAALGGDLHDVVKKSKSPLVRLYKKLCAMYQRLSKGDRLVKGKGATMRGVGALYFFLPLRLLLLQLPLPLPAPNARGSSQTRLPLLSLNKQTTHNLLHTRLKKNCCLLRWITE